MEPVVWTVDSAAVYGEYHEPAVPRKAVGNLVCLHGLNTGLREFGDFPVRMAEEGFHVLAFDQRGFGASGGEPGRIGLDRALADTEGAIAALEERAGRRPLGAVGHSLGGAYALGIQARTGAFAALAVAHPVDRLLDELNPVVRGVFHGIGRLHGRRIRKGRRSLRVPYPVMYGRMFEDVQAKKEAKDERLLVRWLNLANYEFANTMKASAWAARVRVPVLCIDSGDDRIVDPAHSRAVFAALGGPTERLVHAGGHSCFRDHDRARVAAECARFFKDRLGGGAS